MSGRIDPTVDPYGSLGMARNPDGSITRTIEIPTTPPCSDPSDSNPILTKDIPVNQSNNTWIRIYIPRKVFESNTADKLPVIFYYHGGGFVLLSAASTLFQEFCNHVASVIPAVIVSPEYRLAPENRLPAAYDDCEEALEWIKTTSDEWLTKYADLSNCYLMGSSAGGNIAYHVGLRAVGCVVDDLNPVKIRGLILHQPFFGGVERTSSEIRLVNDKMLPLCVCDVMWELALPIGVDRDHEYCNPTVGINSEVLEKIKDREWKILITGREGDPLIDRQIELAKILKERGLRVVEEFSEGGFHGHGIIDFSKEDVLFRVFKEFIQSS